MYTLLYKIYFVLKSKQKKQPLSLLQQKVIDYIEWYYNIPWTRWYSTHPSKKYGLNKSTRQQKIIVSLTSYPKRIDTLWITIETLFRQSVKPDEVILWLAKSQFDGMHGLPDSLLRLQNRGLKIRFCDDLRSHKKYFYALQKYPSDLVILADDDMFYPRDTIRKLMKLHNNFPQDICCITAQVIEPEFTSPPSFWRNPRVDEHNWQHSNRLQVYTGSGTLIPPGTLSLEVFDEGMIHKLCPYADDLWITFMAYRQGTKFSTLQHWRAFPISIYGTAAGSLYYVNGEQKQNDVQWKNLLNQYGVPEHVE